MNLDAIYEPTIQAPELLPTLRFPRLEWRVYETLARPPAVLTARTIAQQLGLSSEGMQAALERLSACGLICIPEMSYEESRSVEAAAPVVVREERRAAPAASGKESGASVSFSLRKRPRATPPPPANTEPRPESPLKLGALLRLVRERAGGGSLGQLAVYRMFLKVPQKMLEAAGLGQLDLDTTDLEVSAPELSDVLREKAREVLGLSPRELSELEEKEAARSTPVL